ncbi:beta strand repeat-containing protein [Leifsonia sp. Root112D2]|uniref:beta strand repeat-containing protein n=1 Tax=Leifsonia sp. Root112D2 TaxID=1736426 RepID=UPI000A6D70BF|nr:DUF11 domain-containing protein [Leifsonia sp. Root112D2]
MNTLYALGGTLVRRAMAVVGLLRKRPILASVVAVLLAVTTIGGVAAAPAMAAPGDLGVTVEWVDLSGNGVTDLTASTSSQTDLQERLVGVRVGYSCGSTACASASVKVDAMPLDPTYSSYRFAAFSSATLPTGATRSGNDANGYTIALGNLGAGSSGSFVMLYTYQVRATAPSPQSFFPEGYAARTAATITSPGLTSASAADAVTWHIVTPDPQISFFTASTAGTQLVTARADSDYTYTDYMTSGCLWDGGGHGEPVYECARSYTASQTLPAGAVFVSASNGGDYNAQTNTVTWTDTGKDAATGWGLLSGVGSPRTVVVRFPSSMITDPNNCVINVDTSLAVDTTYLSGATRSASSSTRHTVNGCTPFASGSSEKFSTSSFATGTSDTVVWAGSSQQWTVRVYNRSNVPAVGTITETLDQAGLPVNRITSPNGSATMTLTLDDATVVTYTGADYTAPAGRTIASATVVTPTIAGPNNVVTDQSKSNYVPIRFYYTVTGTVPLDGFSRTNTAQVSLAFPDNPELGTLSAAPANATVLVTRKPAVFAPTLTAAVPGGGNPVSGQLVTFTMTGVTSNQETGVASQPQYVFVAPAGWTIQPNSAAIVGLSDATFTYKTVVVNGETRQAVYAARPAGTVWGINATWPAMTVKASPDASLPANTLSTAQFYQGDAGHNYGAKSAVWGATLGNAWGSYRYDDAADLDGDGVTTESYAYVETQLRIGSASGLVVTKEICKPDSSQSDGCLWVSDPSSAVPVSPNTPGIKYRVTISNGGNTALSNVVGYDILPYPGDTGATSASAATSRGSTFTEHIKSASGVTGVTLAYSTSANPCRAEVYPSAPGCVSDWGSTAAGAQAVKMTVDALAVGASAQFSYLADVIGDPAAGDKACNSVAVSSSSTPVTEPPAVCAVVEAADLSASGPATIDTQIGRPTTVPFTFENIAGTSTPATVKITLTAGVDVTDLAPAGWTCTAATAAPVTGPAELNCTRTPDFAVGFPATMNLDTIVTATGASITSAIAGSMFDANADNNEHTTKLVATAAATSLAVTKGDGVSAASVGENLTYSIDVKNPLAFEPLGAVTITDTLPAGLQFVSASNGGKFDDGVVTWTLKALSPAATGTVSVTVRVLDSVADHFTNGVQATAADPAFPGQKLTGSATDTDALAALSLTKTGSASNATNPAPGDTITYTFTARNTGGAPLSGVGITDTMAGLSAITFGAWPSSAGTLGEGEQVKATATYTLTQTDIDAGKVVNTAQTSATTADKAAVDATAGTTVNLGQAPAIQLTKSGEALIATAGDQATFTLVAKNTGNVTLTGVDLTDSLGGLSALSYSWPAGPGLLVPGQSVTATAGYSLTQDDVDAHYVENDATVTGTAPNGAAVAADATVRVNVPSTTSLKLTKSGTVNSAGDAAVGDIITWSFELVNDGDVTLTSADIDDTLNGVSAIYYTWPAADGVLAPNATVTATATSTITQADVDRGYVINEATASAKPASGPAVIATGEARVNLAQHGALTLTKKGTIGAGEVKAGDKISYTFDVENTGNVTVDGVDIADPLPGLTSVTYGAWPGASGVLAPGSKVSATAVYAVTQADIDAGTVHNAAIAKAKTPTAGDVLGTAETDVPLAATASIRLVKTGNYGGAALATPGGLVDFTFEITNTGNLTLTRLGITDGLTGLSNISYAAWPGSFATLAPGQKVTATATYAVTQKDIDAGAIVNAATAVGTPSRGSVVTSDSEVTVALPSTSGLAVVKTATLSDANHDSKANPDEAIGYTFAITNTGTVTITDVGIDDPKVAVTGTIAAIGPGQTLVLTSKAYTVTQADAKAGKVVNTATAHGTLPNQITIVSDPSTATTIAGIVPAPIVQTPTEVAADAALARTGSDVGLGVLAASLLFVLAGLLLVVINRRRRRNA